MLLSALRPILATVEVVLDLLLLGVPPDLVCNKGWRLVLLKDERPYWRACRRVSAARAFMMKLRDSGRAVCVCVRRPRGGEARVCTRVGGGPGGMVIARDVRRRGVGVGQVRGGS